MNKFKIKLLHKKLFVVALIALFVIIFAFTRINKISKTNKVASSEYSVTINKTTIDISKVITNEPNEPMLGAGMIPIKWDTTQKMWQITTKDDPTWYDYSNGNLATIMLSDGKYSSEVEINKILAVEGTLVLDKELGSIFSWVPRLMYKDSQIEYLKNTCLVEFDWTTPNCFAYEKQGANEIDLALTGIWVSKQTGDSATLLNNVNQMNIEDNGYGLIKNEIASIISDEERIVIEKLNEKMGNIQNETSLISLQSVEYKQVIKILKTNMYAKLAVQQKISNDAITLKIFYAENKIQAILDENGNSIKKDIDGNSYYDIDPDIDFYVFYVIDTEGNIKKHSYTPPGKPDLTGFNVNTTFFVVYDENGNEESLIPIGEKAPNGWYSYEAQMWANIVVRNNGDEAYFTWIPRYMYKLNTTTQRSEIKLVDKDNKYTNVETGKTVSLGNSGYILPEAFTWDGKPIRGYWISKYQLADTSTYKPEITGGSGLIRVKNIIENLGSDYTYEMYLIKDGKRVVWDSSQNKYMEGTTPIILTSSYTFTNLEAGNYAVSIILRDSSKKFIKAINNEVTVLENVKAEEPDLTGFNKDITFYVTYDSSGNETSVIPIGETAPSNWYDYDNQIWANIVVRNNEQESYFVWIPRYEYKLDSSNQRSSAVFIPKSKTTADSGYTIPEAFTWDGKPIGGYWMSKYQLGEGTSTLTAAIAGGFDTIRVSDIVNKTSKSIATYEAYLIKDGIRVAGPVTIRDEYTFTGLEYGKYTVHLIGQEASGNQAISLTRTVDLQEIEIPSVVGFMVDTTYIVTYDNSGNTDETQTLRDVLKDGANINSSGALVSGEIDLTKIKEGQIWYNYSKQIWPNIVTRNNQKEAYFVWVPRYEYMLDTTNQRSRVTLIPKSKTTADSGYTIPEAFTWDGSPISGYWISKYQLGS